ncbi:unnamed protein product [Microthlaspi erraticum]|uniref:Reverse transcriptase Ty1/copia-type domain-containing protein n=1 Tax=Microthlaspi erraticum TaxID=1685480 RepID=A0A6D2K214_9BRAS|nr:unnamed protein product [Microthlaspi erraticum]
MGTEVGALEGQHTWDITELPPGKVAIGCKWVYKTKFNSDGTVERYKARLVILGNQQEEGVDFKETFAPVIKMNTVRILLEISAAKGWELHQMDVHNAFLHGDLEEEVYMKLPPGFKATGPNQVCKLAKVTLWSPTSSEMLRGKSIVYVLVYVDDLVIGGSDPVLISNFKAYLNRQFHMNDLGVLKYFLGNEVARSSDGIYLSQQKYALDIITESGLLGARPIDTPMEENHALARDKGAFFDDPVKYRRLVGRLVYLTVTKPDLSYAVHTLAQFMQKPRLKHWHAALRVVRYLKKAPGQGIFLSANNDLALSAYCDSDYAACPLTRRSLTGYVVMLGDSLVSWKTKKQKVVSRSTAEAEYRAMAITLCEVKWIVELLSSLGIKQQSPVPLYCDNQAALYIAANPVFHERTKHVEVDCHFIRDAIIDGLIVARHVGTKNQLADIRWDDDITYESVLY